MTLPHTITLYARSQAVSGGLYVSPSSGTGSAVQASVQPLRSQEAYDRFGVEGVQGVKVFLAPDTAIPANPGFTYGGTDYVVEGPVEPHIYGLSSDHLKMYARTPV